MIALDRRAGYALPTVLAVVAILALVFVSAASALKALAAGARAATDGAEFQRAAMSAEAESLMAAATSRFAVDGLQAGGAPPPPGAPAVRSRLRLDGTPYAWGGDPSRALTVGLQDEAGLMNLDASRPDALLRLFARAGLPQTQAETLRDRLLDALDADDDRRPRGAERADYLTRGRAPPPPGGFTSLAEVNGVLDAGALLDDAQRRRLAAWATADPASQGFNVNTAPPEVLADVLSLAPEEAARIVAAREAAPITSLAQLGLSRGDAEARAVRPNGVIRFTFTDRRRGLTYRSRLSARGDPGAAPWAASGAVLGRTALNASETDATVLPDPTRPPPSR